MKYVRTYLPVCYGWARKPFPWPPTLLRTAIGLIGNPKHDFPAVSIVPECWNTLVGTWYLVQSTCILRYVGGWYVVVLLSAWVLVMDQVTICLETTNSEEWLVMSILSQRSREPGYYKRGHNSRPRTSHYKTYTITPIRLYGVCITRPAWNRTRHVARIVHPVIPITVLRLADEMSEEEIMASIWHLKILRVRVWDLWVSPCIPIVQIHTSPSKSRNPCAVQLSVAHTAYAWELTRKDIVNYLPILTFCQPYTSSLTTSSLHMYISNMGTN